MNSPRSAQSRRASADLTSLFLDAAAARPPPPPGGAPPPLPPGTPPPPPGAPLHSKPARGRKQRPDAALKEHAEQRRAADEKREQVRTKGTMAPLRWRPCAAAAAPSLSRRAAPQGNCCRHAPPPLPLPLAAPPLCPSLSPHSQGAVPPLVEPAVGALPRLLLWPPCSAPR